MSKLANTELPVRSAIPITNEKSRPTVSKTKQNTKKGLYTYCLQANPLYLILEKGKFFVTV